MGYFDLLLLLVWVIPSVVMTQWTLFTIACFYIYKEGSKFPLLAVQHVLGLSRYPFSRIYPEKLCFSECAWVLLLGLIPVISLVMFMLHMFFLVIHIVVSYKEKTS